MIKKIWHLAGSMVVYGRATYVVTSCGMNSQAGKIANLLETAENKQTPLQRKLDDFGKKFRSRNSNLQLHLYLHWKLLEAAI